MKKKIFLMIFAVCMIVPAIVLLTACGKDKTETEEVPANQISVLFSVDNTTLLRFDANNSVTEYEVPEGVTDIHENAFSNCSKLTKVILPSSLKIVGNNAFKNCNNLITIQITSEIAVYENAFYGCEKLSNIDTSKITSYGKYAFYGCNSLSSVVISKKVAILPEGLFSQPEDTVWGESKSNLYSVTFEENSNLRWIQKNAFLGCENLTSIDLPESCCYIGNSAFEGSGLKSIVIGGNVGYVLGRAFYNCRNLTSVEFEPNKYSKDYGFNYAPSNFEYIFGKCYNLVSVKNYPDDEIYKGCFSECYNLSTFTFGEYFGYTGHIEERAFEYCYSLKEFTIPATTYSIGYRAFSDCRNLYKVTISEDCDLNLNYVDDYAFADCTALFEIYNLSSSMNIVKGEGIAKYAKNVYTSLSEKSKIETWNNVVYYEDDTNYIAIALEDRNLSNFSLRDSTTEINQYAFAYCDNLKEVQFNSKITKIGRSAFAKTSITEIEIPESVATIEINAFDIASLKTVVINSETIANSFETNSSNGKVINTATNVYIKDGLEVENSSYLMNNFTKQETSDKTGYNLWTKN